MLLIHLSLLLLNFSELNFILLKQLQSYKTSSSKLTNLAKADLKISIYILTDMKIKDTVKHELRVTSYELRIESLKARVESLKAQV